jgi:hypothetical protein
MIPISFLFPILPVILLLLRESRLGAADHLDYKFEYYGEERDRIQVRTHTALFETDLTHWLSLKGSVVYDGISGATPTGGPPLTGTTRVPTARIQDARYAGTLAPDFKCGRHMFTPQLAVSVEDDYQSIAPSLNYQCELNQRNTTLHLGVAHNFDRQITGIFVAQPQQRDTTDFLLGVGQALTPTTLANVTLTFGTASGYLSDPYKGFRFRGYPVEKVLFPERRPGHRTKQILSTSLNQFFEAVHGSAELTYRFYHDSFGVFGHTVTLEWFQNVGRHVVVAPLFRYYEQSAADFYLLSFDADPSDPDNPNNALVPQHYSSDYRLSHLQSFTYGLSATVKFRRWLLLDAAWKRYEMSGLDGVTSASAYPRANIYTVGVRLNF